MICVVKYIKSTVICDRATLILMEGCSMYLDEYQIYQLSQYIGFMQILATFMVIGSICGCIYIIKSFFGAIKCIAEGIVGSTYKEADDKETK